jgi:hypothetical protein
MVTTKNAIEGDNIGLGNLVGQLHKVAVIVSDFFLYAAPFGLSLGNPNISAGCVDASYLPDTILQQGVLDSPYSSPNIEQSFSVHVPLTQCLNQPARCFRRPITTIIAQFTLGHLGVELNLNSLTLLAAHL